MNLQLWFGFQLGVGVGDSKFGGEGCSVSSLKWSDLLCSKKDEAVHEPLSFEAPSMVEGVKMMVLSYKEV